MTLEWRDDGDAADVPPAHRDAAAVLARRAFELINLPGRTDWDHAARQWLLKYRSWQAGR